MNYMVDTTHALARTRQVFIIEGRGDLTKREAWDYACHLAMPAPKHNDPRRRKGQDEIVFFPVTRETVTLLPASSKPSTDERILLAVERGRQWQLARMTGRNRPVRPTVPTPLPVQDFDENEAEAALIAEEIEAEQAITVEFLTS
jgi:hypothetical protein